MGARKAKKKVDWYSTPDDMRHRLEVRWTLPREVIDAVKRKADDDGVKPSVAAEDAIRAALGMPARKA